MSTECCRTCLSTTNLKPIFQYPAKFAEYTNLLYIATGLKIVINDNLPQKICTNCIKVINKYIEFRKQCHNSHTKLSSFKVHFNNSDENLTENIDDDDNDFKDNSNEYNERNVKKNEISYLSDGVNKNYDSKCNENKDAKGIKIEPSSYVEFEMTVEEALKRKLDLSFMNRVRKRKVELKYVAVEPVVKKEKNPESKPPEGPLECEYCHKVLKSKSSLFHHHQIHRGPKIICEHCGKTFLSNRKLTTHCKSKHGYQKTDKCGYCDYLGSNPEQVKIHERIHTGERPHVCAACGAAFMRLSSYLQHASIHLPEKTVPCPECPSLFKSMTMMRIHRNRHRRRRAKDQNHPQVDVK